MSSHHFSSEDRKQLFIIIAILAIAGGCYWFILPAIQSLIIPRAAGGKTGPWVVRPIFAYRLGAVVVMAGVTLVVISGPLRRMLEREDDALGTRHESSSGESTKEPPFAFKGYLYLSIYAAGLVFYLFSWIIIAPDGIEQRLPWTTLHHPFHHIESLETIPDGQRSNSIKRDGPWYSIKLRSGRIITLSTDNEGSTPEELAAMTSFIANRSGLVWLRRRDAHSR